VTAASSAEKSYSGLAGSVASKFAPGLSGAMSRQSTGMRTMLAPA